MIIPGGQAADTMNSKQKTSTYKNTNQYTVRDIRQDPGQAGRENIEIQTDQFVEEFTDKAPHYEIGV